MPISYTVLAETTYGRSTGWDLSLDLWNFISKRLGVTLYERRVTLASDIEGNGFELWRNLFCQYEGGDEYIQLDGRTSLQHFPAMSSTAGITEKLKDWRHQMMKFGADIGPVT